MANNFIYRENRITKMTVKGMLDADTMTINVDDVDKKLSTLLSDFNGAEIAMTIKVQEDMDLDEPMDEE